jgi:hypothetical protein
MHYYILLIFCFTIAGLAFEFDNLLTDEDNLAISWNLEEEDPSSDALPQDYMPMSAPDMATMEPFLPGEDPHSQGSPELWTASPYDVAASWESALNYCTSSDQDPSIISKSRLKSRSEVCDVKQETVYFPGAPANFQDLDESQQAESLRNLICPSSLAQVPDIPQTVLVCSSRLPENTSPWTLSNSEWTLPWKPWNVYVLRDSFVLTVRDLSYCVLPRKAYCCSSWEETLFSSPDGSHTRMGVGTGYWCSEALVSAELFQWSIPAP